MRASSCFLRVLGRINWLVFNLGRIVAPEFLTLLFLPLLDNDCRFVSMVIVRFGVDIDTMMKNNIYTILLNYKPTKNANSCIPIVSCLCTEGMNKIDNL